MTTTRRLCFLGFAALITIVLAACLPSSGTGASGKPFFERQVLLGAHRAGGGLWPENTLASFIPGHMDRVRQLAPGIATCYDFVNGAEMLNALRGGDWAGYTPKADVLSLMVEMMAEFKLTPEEIQAIRAKGVRVQVHTLNTPEEMAHYLDIGVDSILSDYPDRLAKAIDDWRARKSDEKM